MDVFFGMDNSGVLDDTELYEWDNYSSDDEDEEELVALMHEGKPSHYVTHVSYIMYVTIYLCIIYVLYCFLQLVEVKRKYINKI